MPSKVSCCTVPPLMDHIFSPKPFTGFSELMLHIEQIQKQLALLKRARLSLQFVKPFFHSSSLLLPACGDTRHPDNIIGEGKGSRTRSGAQVHFSQLPPDFPLFLTQQCINIHVHVPGCSPRVVGKVRRHQPKSQQPTAVISSGEIFIRK